MRTSDRPRWCVPRRIVVCCCVLIECPVGPVLGTGADNDRTDIDNDRGDCTIARVGDG